MHLLHQLLSQTSSCSGSRPLLHCLPIVTHAASVHKSTGEMLNVPPRSSGRAFFHKSFFLCNYRLVLYFWHSPLSKPTTTVFSQTHTCTAVHVGKYKCLPVPVWKPCLWSASGFSRHVHMTFFWHFLFCSKYVVTCGSRKPPKRRKSAVANSQGTAEAKM